MQTLIVRYRPKGILLDTNLLLLLFVGLADSSSIGDFRRIQNHGFTEKEYLLLANIVGAFSKIVTTPHILTETSNFILQHKGQARPAVMETFRKSVESFKERRPESKTLVQSGAFRDFGLTDSAILDLPPKRYLVLSVDLELVVALKKKGVDAINFNHLRQSNWLQ